MNERLRAFRRRLRSRTSTPRSADRWKAKDYLTIGISIAALLVALTTSFFSVVWQLDDVRVVIGETPSVYLNEANEVVLEGSQTITFINSGNRQAAITRFQVHAIPLVGPINDKETCENPWGPLIPFVFKRMVLKPSEIVHLELPLTDEKGFWQKRKDGSLVLEKSISTPKHEDSYLVCLTLDVVTPDSYVEWSRRPIFKITFAEPLTDSERQVALFERGRPIPIVQRNGYIFSRFFDPNMGGHPSSEEMLLRRAKERAEEDAEFDRRYPDAKKDAEPGSIILTPRKSPK